MNKKYMLGFSFSYNSFILGKNKKKLLTNCVIDKIKIIKQKLKIFIDNRDCGGAGNIKPNLNSLGTWGLFSLIPHLILKKLFKIQPGCGGAPWSSKLEKDFAISNKCLFNLIRFYQIFCNYYYFLK